MTDTATPQVSIIVPLCNQASSIACTLDSIVAQPLPTLEILIIDYGSTDDGLAIVQKYHDPRIRIITLKNCDVSEAKNTGVVEARASRIIFLEAGEEWSSQFLEPTTQTGKSTGNQLWEWMQGKS